MWQAQQAEEKKKTPPPPNRNANHTQKWGKASEKHQKQWSKRPKYLCIFCIYHAPSPYVQVPPAGSSKQLRLQASAGDGNMLKRRDAICDTSFAKQGVFRQTYQIWMYLHISYLNTMTASILWATMFTNSKSYVQLDIHVQLDMSVRHLHLHCHWMC